MLQNFVHLAEYYNMHLQSYTSLHICITKVRNTWTSIGHGLFRKSSAGHHLTPLAMMKILVILLISQWRPKAFIQRLYSL